MRILIKQSPEIFSPVKRRIKIVLYFLSVVENRTDFWCIDQSREKENLTRERFTFINLSKMFCSQLLGGKING
jgi:hypothetical protein